MELAIIAAGQGSRLKEEGIGTSKPMVRIQGKTLIERSIEMGLSAGANAVSIIINEEETELRHFLESMEFGVELRLKVKSTPSSMHSLLEMESLIQDQDFMLMTCDSIFAKDEFIKYAEFAKKQRGTFSLATTGFIEDEKPLFIETDREDRITAFLDQRSDRSDKVTGGIYYLNRNIFGLREYALSQNIIRLRNFLRLLLSRGYSFKSFCFSKIIDVDHISDIILAEEFLNKAKN